MKSIITCKKNSTQENTKSFVDNSLNFSDSSFNSFSTSTCFVLFEVIFLSIFFSLLSESVFYTKLAISFLLAKFNCASLALKLSDVNLLNFWVLIYLSWSVIILFSISLILRYSQFFKPRSLVSVVSILLTFLTNSLQSFF